MNKYMLLNHQNNFFTHFGVCYDIIRSLLKYTNLNITEFLTKILLFLEYCAFSGLSQDLSDKKKIS